jgi:hypothetical protein
MKAEDLKNSSHVAKYTKQVKQETVFKIVKNLIQTCYCFQNQLTYHNIQAET